MDELEELIGNSEGEHMVVGGGGELEWDFMGWEEHYSPYEGPKEGEDGEAKIGRESLGSEVPVNFGIGIKEENRVGFWEQNNISLNLSLNYQDVMDAWSDRGPLFADHHHCSIADAKHSISEYAGEAPTMEDEEQGERRRARVLKYREKRHNRLFSKTIRYEVRKINAEKRPRLKGRFVKRNTEKIMLR